MCRFSLYYGRKCYIINTSSELINAEKERLRKMIYLVKIFPLEHKIHGKERIAYAFSDVRADDSGDVFDDALCQILDHRDRVGLLVDDDYAREVVRSRGICALNRYMDYANIEMLYDDVWYKD